MSSLPISCSCQASTLITPPKLDDIVTDWPDVVPDTSIDRDVPRCKNCDESRARQWEQEAQARLSSGANIDAWTGELREMYHALKLARSDYQLMLHQAEAKRELAIKYERAAIYLAWMPFWAVWGKLEGQGWMQWPRDV